MGTSYSAASQLQGFWKSVTFEHMYFPARTGTHWRRQGHTRLVHKQNLVGLLTIRFHGPFFLLIFSWYASTFKYTLLHCALLREHRPHGWRSSRVMFISPPPHGCGRSLRPPIVKYNDRWCNILSSEPVCSYVWAHYGALRRLTFRYHRARI
jgi:hypothetical protein